MNFYSYSIDFYESENEEILEGNIMKIDEHLNGGFPLRLNLDFNAFDKKFSLHFFRNTFEHTNNNNSPTTELVLVYFLLSYLMTIFSSEM